MSFYKTYVNGSIGQRCVACNLTGCQFCMGDQPSSDNFTNLNTSCVFCNITSMLLPNGTCFNCPNDCYTCINNTNYANVTGNNNTINCTSCFLGYYLINSSCLACGSGCVSCINGSYCLSCNSSSYLNGTYNMTQACIPCSNVTGNCSICSNKVTCTKCLAGTYLFNNQCNSCAQNCSACYNSTHCNSCDNGFFLNQSRLCAPCGNSCSSCLSGAVCTLCVNGNYLDGQDSECVICPSGCSSCQSANNCTACQSGYSIVDNLCVSPGEVGLTWWEILLIVLGGCILIALIGTFSLI